MYRAGARVVVGSQPDTEWWRGQGRVRLQRTVPAAIRPPLDTWWDRGNWRTPETWVPGAVCVHLVARIRSRPRAFPARVSVL